MTEEKSIIDLAQGRTPQTAGMEDTAKTAIRPGQRTGAPEKGDKTEEFSKIMDSLLENVAKAAGWREVDLPSRQTTEVRPFTYEDERLLRSVTKNSEGSIVLKQLIENCTKDVDVDNLSASDFTYLLFKLRELSYGDEYKITVECEECDSSNVLTVELSKLNVNYATDEYTSSPKITLPDSGKNVTLRRPRVKDSKNLEDISKLTENLWRFVSEIEGHTDRMIIQTFITKTTVKDVATIRETLLKDDIGLDTAVRYVCKECNSDTSIQLPLTADFFTVS